MTMLLEFLERHRARYLFRSSHLKRRGPSYEILKVFQLRSFETTSHE